MKMVHLISWKEYQDIVLKLRSGDENISLPNPELFDCVICGVSVKYKREHLNKKHQLDEDVYEALIAKKARGEDISADLPEREVYTCAICERECMDFKRHLQVWLFDWFFTMYVVLMVLLLTKKYIRSSPRIF